MVNMSAITFHHTIITCGFHKNADVFAMLQLDLAMKYLNDNYLIDCNKVLSQIFLTPRG